MPTPGAATNDTPVIVTDRLRLSYGVDGDDAVPFPYVHGEMGREVTDFLIWDGPEQPGDMAEFFKLHATGTLAQRGFHWSLRDRDGSLTGSAGEAIGAIGVRTTDDPEVCDIGYWLALQFWGRGLMGEAISAVVHHALGHTGFAAVAATYSRTTLGALGSWRSSASSTRAAFRRTTSREAVPWTASTTCSRPKMSTPTSLEDSRLF